jgi:hypothetical protein
MKPSSTLLLCFLALGAAAATAQPREHDDDDPLEYRDRQEARDAYRRGFERGYERGFRKGMEEGERRVAAPPAPPPPPPPPLLGPIRVAGAFYGTLSRTCDATGYVARRADGKKSWSLKVHNEMCGDPAKGDRKNLEVTYWCGQVSRTASAREHQTIYLSCL